MSPSAEETPSSDVLLDVRDLHVTFPVTSKLLRRQVGEVHAVSGVDFTVRRGETLGLVGESGCGKTTVARTILGLERAKAGQVLFDDKDLTRLSTADLRRVRRDVQMIFQDPYSSLNPRRTVRQIIAEAWEVHPDVVPKERWATEAGQLLERVGLNPDHADRYPHQFSGGQRQRIGIARALALRPKLIVCDEPVSALDVSIQAQILNLLQDLQSDLGLSYLFIAHDLAVVRHIAERIAVMYLGRIVEIGEAATVYTSPTHPYTQALLSAVPSPEPWQHPDRTRILLDGDLPSPVDPPSGCRFRTRCWKVETRCADEVPALEQRCGLTSSASACHFARIERSVTA